jgi:hypothetical protein
VKQSDLAARPYANADLASIVDLFFACRAARRLGEWTMAQGI